MMSQKLFPFVKMEEKNKWRCTLGCPSSENCKDKYGSEFFEMLFQEKKRNFESH